MAFLNRVTAPHASFPLCTDEDYQEVGSLGAFQHKLRMANDPAYRTEAVQEARRPKTLREVLGLGEGLSMRSAFPFAVRV